MHLEPPNIFGNTDEVKARLLSLAETPSALKTNGSQSAAALLRWQRATEPMGTGERAFRRIAQLLIGLLGRGGESRSTYKPRDVCDDLAGVRQAAESLPAEDVFRQRATKSSETALIYVAVEETGLSFGEGQSNSGKLAACTAIAA